MCETPDQLRRDCSSDNILARLVGKFDFHESYKPLPLVHSGAGYDLLPTPYGDGNIQPQHTYSVTNDTRPQLLYLECIQMKKNLFKTNVLHRAILM
jgi:hypothetical protein